MAIVHALTSSDEPYGQHPWVQSKAHEYPANYLKDGGTWTCQRCAEIGKSWPQLHCRCDPICWKCLTPRPNVDVTLVPESERWRLPGTEYFGDVEYDAKTMPDKDEWIKAGGCWICEACLLSGRITDLHCCRVTDICKRCQTKRSRPHMKQPVSTCVVATKPQAAAPIPAQSPPGGSALL